MNARHDRTTRSAQRGIRRGSRRPFAAMVLAMSVVTTACSSSSKDGDGDTTPLQGAGGEPLAGAGSGNVAPGGAPSVVPGGGGTTSLSGAGGSVAVAGGSGGATAGAGGAVVAPGAGGANAGGAPAVDPPGTVTLETDLFDLAPGQEIYKCQNWDNPFGGKDTPVSRIVTDMTPGSHHLHVYNLTEGTSRALEDCDISDFHALVHAAASPHAETNYGAGMAAKIRGNNGLRMQLHYINLTEDTLHVGATLKLTPTADPASIENWVAELYLNRGALQVPPGQGKTVQTTCGISNVYGPISLIQGGAHMHMRGVRFVATTGTPTAPGVPLIDTNQWEEPPAVNYDPPIPLTSQDSVTWTCTYDNDSTKTYTFGPSAKDNEMCIFVGKYYSSNADDTQLECQAYSPNGPVVTPHTN